MGNELPPAIYMPWDELQKQKHQALVDNDQNLLTIIDAKILKFAQSNSIDLTSPVTLDATTPLDPKIHADQTGVDGSKVYKIKALTSGGLAQDSKLEYAYDGKKSTSAKVQDWIAADIGDLGNIESIALKLESATDATFTFDYSTNGFTWMPISTGTATVALSTANEFDYFTFPIVVRAQFIRINHAGPFSVTTLQILENPPNANPKPPEPTKDGKYPIPQGFSVDGDPSTDFKFWGRTTTNYNSGGAGPSLRWDCVGIQSVNVLAGYTFNLGTKHGKRGDDNIDLKCRGNSHSDGKGGWYIPFCNWYVNHKKSDTGCGKEFTHPSTEHYKWNVDDPKPDIGDIGDGQWHTFMVAVFNDKRGVPTMMGWYNQKASGKIEDFVYLGKSKDTGNMTPGPVLTKIAQKGGGKQSLQVRMDERPDGKIKDAFAFALADTPE